MNKECIDLIDLVVSRVYRIEPHLLRTKNRHERVAHARFLCIHYRRERGDELEGIAAHYGMDVPAVRYGLRKVVSLRKYDCRFRRLYDETLSFLSAQRMPYMREKIIPGAKVYTRVDSGGNVRQGVVTEVSETMFYVESFEDPVFKTVNWLDSGRVHRFCETSFDIVAIDA